MPQLAAPNYTRATCVAIRHLTPDASRAVSLTGFNPAPRTLLLTLPEP